MNADLSIVATNVGDNDRLISGENGYLCKVKDCSEIAKYLLKLVKDDTLRTSMGMNSKNKLLSEYSMDIFRERYIRLLSSFLK